MQHNLDCCRWKVCVRLNVWDSETRSYAHFQDFSGVVAGTWQRLLTQHPASLLWLTDYCKYPCLVSGVWKALSFTETLFRASSWIKFHFHRPDATCRHGCSWLLFVSVFFLKLKSARLEALHNSFTTFTFLSQEIIMMAFLSSLLQCASYFSPFV